MSGASRRYLRLCRTRSGGNDQMRSMTAWNSLRIGVYSGPRCSRTCSVTSRRPAEPRPITNLSRESGLAAGQVCSETVLPQVGPEWSVVHQKVLCLSGAWRGSKKRMKLIFFSRGYQTRSAVAVAWPRMPARWACIILCCPHACTTRGMETEGSDHSKHSPPHWIVCVCACRRTLRRGAILSS